jgi:peptide/nickel transport system substrate-binding protein
MSARIRTLLAAAALTGTSLFAAAPTVLAHEHVNCDDVSPRETLTVAMDGDVETIDPMFSHFQKANEVNYNLNDQFFLYGTQPHPETGTETYDPTVILGSSVESWEMSEDGLTIDLNIREGKSFNRTGNPVTADDFIYWFERAVGTESGGLWNIDTGKISSWEKTGDHSIRLTFSDKSPYFFYLFRDQSQAPLDMLAITANATDDDPWATRWVAGNDTGSGEYTIQHWTPGQEMVLCANADYWAGEPYFKRVVLRFIPSEADRVLLLAQGEVDIAQTLSVDALDSLRDAPGVRVISEPTRNQILMGLNNGIEPFDNVLVRQALSWAMPYERIVSEVFGGQAQLSKGPIPVGGQYFDESLWTYSYDPDTARGLLAEAGYPDGFSFQVHIAIGDASIEQLAVFLQTSFREIGVEMQIQQDTPAIFAEGQDARTQQAWIRDLLWYVDDPGYTASAFFTPGCCNWAAYESDAVNDLTARMSVLFDEGEDRVEKEALSKDYQRIVIEDAPVLYLAQTNFQLAVRDDITGYQQGPDNILWYYPLARD